MEITFKIRTKEIVNDQSATIHIHSNQREDLNSAAEEMILNLFSAEFDHLIKDEYDDEGYEAANKATLKKYNYVCDKKTIVIFENI